MAQSHATVASIAAVINTVKYARVILRLTVPIVLA